MNNREYYVDNALSARTQLTEEGAALARSLTAAQTTEHLMEVRCRTGAISLSAYLAAQDARRLSELAVSGNRLAQLESYATPVLKPRWRCQPANGVNSSPKKETGASTDRSICRLECCDVACAQLVCSYQRAAALFEPLSCEFS